MEVYELINGKRAVSTYRDGRRTSTVIEGSSFWTNEDTAWFDVVHARYGLMSYQLPIRNPLATFLTFSQE